MSRETQLAKRKKEKNIFENIPEGGYLGQLARKLKIKARKEKQTGTKFERRQKSIKKGTNQRTEINNKRKLEKLKEKNARGRTTSTKKKSLSNIPVQERSAPVNKKARGLSSLGADYAKQEKKFSKKAKEESEKTYAKRFPKMGTYKNSKGESYADEKKKSKSDLKVGKYFTWKGKRYKAGSVTARKAENQMRARKRAQEAAKKRLANK